jgi:hypothetical protein
VIALRATNTHGEVPEAVAEAQSDPINGSMVHPSDPALEDAA